MVHKQKYKYMENWFLTNYKDNSMNKRQCFEQTVLEQIYAKSEPWSRLDTISKVNSKQITKMWNLNCKTFRRSHRWKSCCLWVGKYYLDTFFRLKAWSRGEKKKKNKNWTLPKLTSLFALRKRLWWEWITNHGLGKNTYKSLIW